MYDLSVIIAARNYDLSTIKKFLFISPALRSLFCFFKKDIAVGSVYSFFIIIAFTCFAISAVFTLAKWMSMDTVCLFCIFGSYSISQQNVLFLGYEFQVIRVATTCIVAKVMELIQSSIFAFSSRNWFYKIGIQNTVNSLFATFVKPLRVSLLVTSSCPSPTIAFCINGYFSKNPFMLFGSQIDFKVFHNFIIGTMRSFVNRKGKILWN